MSREDARTKDSQLSETPCAASYQAITSRSVEIPQGPVVPPCVYLLADHLDAALAAGEDLVAAGESWDNGDPCDPGVAGMQRWAIGRIRAHEMSLLSRIMRARDKASELAHLDKHFRLIAHLFVSGTADLADAVAEAVDLSDCAFETGDDAIAYLRTRGLIDPEAPGVSIGQDLNLGDNFTIVGRVPLGIVLDLVAEFLETLDAHFTLYPAEAETASEDVPAADALVDGTTETIASQHTEDEPERGDAAERHGAPDDVEETGDKDGSGHGAEQPADTEGVLTVVGLLPSSTPSNAMPAH